MYIIGKQGKLAKCKDATCYTIIFGGDALVANQMKSGGIEYLFPLAVEQAQSAAKLLALLIKPFAYNFIRSCIQCWSEGGLFFFFY